MKIDHAALFVADLEGGAAFFETYFGGRRNHLYHNGKTGLSTYILSFEGGARLELMHLPSVAERGSQHLLGFAHVSFSVGSREPVDALTARLREDGYTVKSGPRVTGDGYYESSVLDKEGNAIEITV